MAVMKEAALSDVAFNVGPDLVLNPYKSMTKDQIFFNTETSRKVDIYARASDPDGVDLIIEVKNWKKPVTMKEIRSFVAL